MMRMENFYILAKFLPMSKFSMSNIALDLLKIAKQIKNLFERFSQTLSRKPEKQSIFFSSRTTFCKQSIKFLIQKTLFCGNFETIFQNI